MFDYIVRKAQEEKKAAEERIKAAYDSIPAEYHKFIILLDKNVKLGKVDNYKMQPELRELGVWQGKDGSLYLPVSLPYMTVDGRIQWARDEHRKAGKALHIRTEVCNGYVRAEVVSELYGSATATAKIGDGDGVDRTNPIENAETSAVGRALGFLGYGLIGTGIASADEVIAAQKETAQVKAVTKENPQPSSNPKEEAEWVKGKIIDIKPARTQKGTVFGLKLDSGETVVLPENHPFMSIIDTYKEHVLEFRCQKSPKGSKYVMLGFGSVKANGQVVA